MPAPSNPPLRLVDLSEADQTLLSQHAASALGRRGALFFRARRALWIDWLLTGSIGMFGIFILGWSASTATLLLLATFWFGWLGDLALWLLHSRALEISYQRAGDDLRFWQVVAILRGKRRQQPEVRSHPTLGLSLCVDFVAGCTASVLLVSGLRTAGIDVLAELSSPSLLISVAIIVIAGIGPGLRARFTPATDGSVPLPVFSVGQRGIGLLVLNFALMAVGGGALSARLVMASAYGFFTNERDRVLGCVSAARNERVCALTSVDAMGESRPRGFHHSENMRRCVWRAKRTDGRSSGPRPASTGASVDASGDQIR